MTIKDITSGQVFITLADAIASSAAGDTIQVSPGTYSENLPAITHALTIEGVGGMPLFQGPAGGLSNGKAFLVTDADVTIRGIEFAGATVADGNGAGIRFETGNLTVIDSWFHGNQDGILTAADPTSTLTIVNSEFDHNGTGDGRTHNLYVGGIGTLSVTGSYFHDAIGGHEIKSRAFVTTIVDSRIQDGPTADTSYAVDLPNGGVATLRGNVIQKSPNAPNFAAVHFGGEADPVYANSSLTITNTIFVNNLDPAHTPRFVSDQAHDRLGALVLPTVRGNIFYGLPVSGVLYDSFAGLFLPLAPLLNSFQPLAAAPTLDTSHSFSVPCFAAGTRIRTVRGEVPVEALVIGDIVVNLWGEHLPVVWLGHRRVDCRRHARVADVLPIRITADAFAPGMPVRDLRLSPDHAVFIDGMLVPARYLVNGASIIREDVATVTYWHIELPRHDVLLAEGMPSESYLDTGNRDAFANGGPAIQAHPDFARDAWDNRACGWLVTEGPALDRLRHALLRRALQLGHRRTAAPLVRLDCKGGTSMPLRHGHSWHFTLPAGVGTARLRSRHAIPGEIRSADRDHRRLGIAVVRMTLDGEELPLSDARLGAGWHDPESGYRWTDGNAALVVDGTRDVVIETRPWLRYWRQDDVARASDPPRGLLKRLHANGERQ